MKTISLLGSTGSIGTQTLDVCRKHNIRVKALAANTNVSLLASQALEFGAEYVCICNDKYYKVLKEKLDGKGIKLLCGTEGLCEIAALDGVDQMVNAVVGMVGLLPTLTAIEHKTDVALANKETLVAGGNIVMKAARENGVKIVPIDSEHSAIFQCLQGESHNRIKKIILTASGGPFHGRTADELRNVTVEEALRHPNWSMGKKITIDSATLVNKGLEFIEACHLFDVSPCDIEILVHRQSVVHSAVEFEDNSVIAQMGVPDMKIPIQYALLYPRRTECDVKPLSLSDYGTLTFEKPDYETFSALSACINAMKMGYAYPCIMNAVNEEAVMAFLDGKISFMRIGELINSALAEFPAVRLESYKAVIEMDRQAREFTISKF